MRETDAKNRDNVLRQNDRLIDEYKKNNEQVYKWTENHQKREKNIQRNLK